MSSVLSMWVRAASEAVPGQACNEDLVVEHGDLVGVFDGVSEPAGLETGCVHGVAWYVRRLGARLVEAAERYPMAALEELLGSAIAAVRPDHGGQCDLGHPGTPAATVSLLRKADGYVDWLVLCESYLVLDDGVEVTVVTDRRFERAVARIRRDFLDGQAAIGSAEHEARVLEAARRRQRMTNTAGGYWIAAAEPEAARHAVTGRGPLAGEGALRRAALLTDGASRAVDTFRLFGWRELLDLVTAAGPEELIRRVREAERGDVSGVGRPRFKRHDDASVVLCEFREGVGMGEVSRHSVSVAAVVTDGSGRVLVVRRRDNGAWQVPGGVLELGETIERGVVREVLEETGVEVRPVRLTGVYKHMRLGVVALVMRAEVVAGQARPTEESAEVGWWTAEQVAEGMTEAFAVRVMDALGDGEAPAVRHHDGTWVL